MNSVAAYYEILQGKTANFIGDSLFGGHALGKENTWIALLAEKYGMIYNNYGVNGCTLSACENGFSPIIERYVEMENSSTDIIVFEGGRNDFNKCAAIGDAESRDTATYCGAVAALIEGLRKKYPKSVIIGVSFWNTSSVNKAGVACNDYIAAMLNVCNAMGVPCINAMDEAASGIRMTDTEFRKQYSMLPGDVCHLNADGMKLALSFFEREIAKILAESSKFI